MTESELRPNIVVILADDLGYSDLGCYGGEIPTPALDALGRQGVRLSSFYNTARCSPSRASLLTGRHPHETGVALLTDDDTPDGYPGSLSLATPTVAELLQERGYATCLSGKWHLASDAETPNAHWPTRRGFDHFYGIVGGADSYFAPRGLWAGEERQPVPSDPDFYLTDAISDHAEGFVRGRAGHDDPFFLYLAYTAPHWPLHAPAAEVAGREQGYRAGWDELRAQRLERQVAEGLVPAGSTLSERDPAQPAWTEVADPEWEASRMAVYAAQVALMDRGIAQVVEALRETGQLENTLILFLSDNGGCAENLPPADALKFRERQPSVTRDGQPIQLGNDPAIMPGGELSYSSYGPAWANLSNTPFRLYKRWVHEGGIASPFIAHWPAGGLDTARIAHAPHQLTDILPTLLDAAGIADAAQPGTSMLPVLRGEAEGTEHPLFWEHMGNCAVRRGDWKLVKVYGGEWELYDLASDRIEADDLAAQHPELATELRQAWQRWAEQVGVIPWDRYPRG